MNVDNEKFSKFFIQLMTAPTPNSKNPLIVDGALAAKPSS
jgi:hypothetical protein